MSTKEAIGALNISHIPGKVDPINKIHLPNGGEEIAENKEVDDIHKEILDYTHHFKSGIEVGINGEIFPKSFGNRELTEDMLDLYEITIQKQKKVIGINGTAHSKEVHILDARYLKDEPLLLEAGIDGVIIINLRLIKNSISLILGVADCAPIAISSKDGNTIGLVHAGWQGVSKDIIGTMIERLSSINTIGNFDFYIGPMAGNNFEFEKKDFDEKFSDLLSKYNFEKDRYFDNGNLNPRLIIKDILLEAGVEDNQISFSDIETNSPHNSWPSFRLHTKYKSIIEKFKKQDIEIINGLTKEERNKLLTIFDSKISLSEIEGMNHESLSKIEIELFLSDNFDIYKKDPRLALFVEN